MASSESLARVAARVKKTSLLNKLVPAENCVQYFKDGQALGWSGFTGVGYPKAVPIAVADHVEKNKLQGKMRFSLFCGASTGPETEDRWASLDMMSRRTPFQSGKNIQKGINSGRIMFQDKHLGEYPEDLMYGYYGRHKPGKKTLDIAIVEATAITEDGLLVPGASVGATPELIASADKVIIEINTFYPNLTGLHDTTTFTAPPYRAPLPVRNVEDRIGTVGIPIDPEKVLAIVESRYPDRTSEADPQDEMSNSIANHIIEFLKHEVKYGRLPANLLPLQSGIGNIANAVVGGLVKAPFENVKVFTEVLQDTFLDYFDSGKLSYASATSIRLSPSLQQKFYDNFDNYKNKIILRQQSISNSVELIRRLGVIAMNTPVEFDIYGHANSTMVQASRMINGLGGSNDFLRNAKISIMHTPSTRPTSKDEHGISCIVPFASHIDSTEHDLDVLVTEQGLADVRGLAPRERARVIIDNCAHPAYKDILKEYFETAEKACLAKGMGHEPHHLDKIFKMHINLRDHGSMRIDKW